MPKYFKNMLMKKIITSLIIISISFAFLQAQEIVEIEGDSKILGNLNILSAIGDSSVFIGANAGINNNATSNKNTFVGVNAGKNNTSGHTNTFLGFSAGKATISGDENVFLGYKAGYSNLNSNNNVFIGYYSGHASTTAYYNVFAGHGSGRYNIGGDDNVFLGYNSARFNKTGGQNVFVGRNSGYNNENGNKNVALGHEAGLSNVHGNNSLYLGALAGPNNNDSLVWATAIGYNAQVDCSHCTVIGGTGTDSVSVGIGTASPEKTLDVHGELIIRDANNVATFLSEDSLVFVRLATNSDSQSTKVGYYNDGSDKYFFIDPPSGGTTKEFVILNNGRVGIGINNPTCKLDVMGNICSNGTVLASDKRYKRDIIKIQNPLEKLSEIQGVSYFMRTEEFKDRNFSKELKLGLIAQNVETIFPELVSTSSDGYKAVNYDGFIPILIEGMNKQQSLIKKQQEQINELKTLITQMAILIKS